MNGQGHVARLDAGPLQNIGNAGQNGGLGRLGRGQQFRAVMATAILQNHIREGAADINGQSRPLNHGSLS